MTTMISTWRMSSEGMKKAKESYKQDRDLDQALKCLIHDVEDNPSFHSVGMGGLPNRDGIIQCDGSYMNGTTLAYGACGAVENIASAFDLAYLLSKEERFNNFLVGPGANEYALSHGLSMKSLMDYPTWQRYIDRKFQDKEYSLSAYDGHDTVCACMVDDYHHCIVGTSTSGLFMKHNGRLGDTPCIGCGFYADDTIGAAAATGVGEAICKGVLSYGVLQRIRLGQSVQDAAASIVAEFTETLKTRYGHDDAISLIVVDKDGNYGVGTNVPFVFVVNTDQDGVQQFLAKPTNNGCIIESYHGQLEID